MFKIEILPDFTCEDGIIGSTCYVRSDGRFFPSDQWTDSPVILLDWWISALLEAFDKHDEDNRFELIFVEGAFVIDCVLEKRTIHMSFIHDLFNGQIMFQDDVKIDMFANELIKVSSNLLADIDAHKWGEKLSDIEKLAENLERLKEWKVMQDNLGSVPRLTYTISTEDSSTDRT